MERCYHRPSAKSISCTMCKRNLDIFKVNWKGNLKTLLSLSGPHTAPPDLRESRAVLFYSVVPKSGIFFAQEWKWPRTSIWYGTQQYFNTWSWNFFIIITNIKYHWGGEFERQERGVGPPGSVHHDLTSFEHRPESERGWLVEMSKQLYSNVANELLAKQHGWDWMG